MNYRDVIKNNGTPMRNACHLERSERTPERSEETPLKKIMVRCEIVTIFVAFSQH
jgi:hypothetical protein